MDHGSELVVCMGSGAQREAAEALARRTGAPLTDAAGVIRDSGLRWRTIGTGETVTDQLPRPGCEIAEGTEVILYLGAEISQEMETVPELTGMSLAEARDTLSYYGIYLTTKSPDAGEDRVVSAQSLPAGTPVEHGTILEVSLIHQEESMLGRY